MTAIPNAPTPAIPPIVECSSSLLSGYGYSQETSTLYLRFKYQGKLYSYANFPLDQYQALREAVSIGKFVSQQVVKKYQGVYVPE